MSPEIGLRNRTVLDESGRIKDVLLDVQAQIDTVARQTEERLLPHIREQLGYRPAPKVKEQGLVDTRIADKTPVITPEVLTSVLPLSRKSAKTTRDSREAITDILQHNDDRLLVIVGPCSIHDAEAALEYAKKVRSWRGEHGADLEIVMRSYMEKPRTERGWKGFIYDPLLDESDDINLGVTATRMTACQLTNLGVPLAMERLNALTPQYVNGLVTYDAIGARNTTDQKAREYASGTSSPVGFKNTPEGNIVAASNAVTSANSPHTFLGMGMNGTPQQVTTAGNDTAHIILRGSQTGTNFRSKYVNQAARLMSEQGLPPAVVIDVSHDNSGKKANRQRFVNADVCRQIAAGELAIRGVMIESNLVGGAQKLKRPDGSLKAAHELVYGQSITDECVDLDQTQAMLKLLVEAAQKRRKASRRKPKLT